MLRQPTHRRARRRRRRRVGRTWAGPQGGGRAAPRGEEPHLAADAEVLRQHQAQLTCMQDPL